MATDAHQTRPVFVVGSPRSGTSVLTWALGQHPDLLLTEESNWLGSFSIQAAAAHAQGSARAMRSQLSALGISRETFLSGLGDAIDRMMLAGRAYLEAAGQATALHSPQHVNPAYSISRDPGDTKARWIDGTPEYSLQIWALVELFPKAQFVHILRDADQVAASLLAFRDERGSPVVGSAEEAYTYWLRTVQACIDAERILGPGLIRRVRYADLVADGERTLRGVLDFLAEPYAPACLEPLEHRINSSFAGGAMPRAYPDTRSAVIEVARRSSAEWLGSQQSTNADISARAGWQTEFETSILYAQGLQGNWEAAQRLLTRMRLTIGLCGALLLVNWLLALALLLSSGGATAAIWLAFASGMMVVYAWWRRAGVRAILVRVLGMLGHRTKPG
ncbi:MAG: sulfotransferase family protein [Rhodanobacteraceae bacterium]